MGCRCMTRRRCWARRRCCARSTTSTSSGPPACGAQPPGEPLLHRPCTVPVLAWEQACPAVPHSQLRKDQPVQADKQALPAQAEQ